MAETSAIAWTRSTFNPWIGCTKVGPGCDSCYAEALDNRHRWKGATHWGAGVPRMRTSIHNWNEPLRWQKKAAATGERWLVFCASLADVFDNEVPQEWRADLWDLIAVTPHLSWLLVTKRISNVSKMAGPYLDIGFPKNIRLLITVCNQEEADRDIPKLLALPCRNGISYEPALGPVDWTCVNLHNALNGEHVQESATSQDWDRHIEWIIIGGESTQGAGKARPFDVGWARSTIKQCKAAGVPVFMKQVGSMPYCEPTLPDGAHQAGSEFSSLKDRAGADPSEWPADLRVREFPI